MALKHILILGAGPTGLSTALSLAKLTRGRVCIPHEVPFQITVLEIRPVPLATGGTINLTPLALRYLDRLGVGKKLREKTIPVRHIDLVSLRTGNLLCNLWTNTDTVRSRRSDLVASLLETCAEPENREHITIRFGVNATSISEEDDQVLLQLNDSSETICGDLLIGCDGIHSATRRLYVEPGRKSFFSGKVVAYGGILWSEANNRAEERTAKPAACLQMADGSRAVTDTTVFSGRYGSIMATFAQPARDRLFVAILMGIPGVGSEGLDRDGWNARHGDQEAVKRDILRRFSEHRVRGLPDVVARVEDWTLFPVYQLPPGGRWHRGRVMIIGDAAHAMPPQGESTGMAIEDGVLMTRVLSRHNERTVPEMFADYEALRRKTIDKLYRETIWRWDHVAIPNNSWLWSIVLEWITIVFVYLSNLRQVDHFASDVEKVRLPEN